jgi:hypothetical protein
MGVVYGYPSLIIALIAIACTQFDKLNAVIHDIIEGHISPHHGQEDQQVRETANSDLQAKLNACILHHQDIME